MYSDVISYKSLVFISSSLFFKSFPSFFLSFFDITILAINATVLLITALTAYIYIMYTHTKISKIQNQIFTNKLTKPVRPNGEQPNDLDLIQDIIVQLYENISSLSKSNDALKSEKIKLEFSCKESIDQAQEASRLAEESRIKNLLSASLKLEQLFKTF